MIKVQVGTNTDRKEVLVPGTVSLKKVLEDERINYNAAIVYLDGAAIRPGDLSKSFDDLGIKETALLTAVVKIADGAKLKAVGRAVVITSDIKLADIQKLKRYNESALVQKDKEGNLLFGVSTANLPSVGAFGISFNDTDPDGKARVTLAVPQSVEDIKAYVKEEYTMLITKLNEFEGSVADKLAALNKTFEDAEKSMELE